MAKSMAEIGQLLNHTKFKKRLFGADEADVWRKLGRLQKEYSELHELTQRNQELQLAAWRTYASSLEQQLAALGAPVGRPPALRDGAAAPVPDGQTQEDAP
jgi:hypothetical protein